MSLANVKLNSLMLYHTYRLQETGSEQTCLQIVSAIELTKGACCIGELLFSISLYELLQGVKIANFFHLQHSFHSFTVNPSCQRLVHLFSHMRALFVGPHRATNDQGMSILRKNIKNNILICICFLLSVTTCQAAAVDKPFHLQDT